MGEMRLTVLAVPGCPNAAVLRDRLIRALQLAGEPDVAVSWREVTDEQQAHELGMRGSPTLLINGVDPLAEPGRPAGRRACPAGSTPARPEVRRRSPSSGSS